MPAIRPLDAHDATAHGSPHPSDLLVERGLFVPAALLFSLPIVLVATLSWRGLAATQTLPVAQLLTATVTTTAIGVGLAAPVGLAVAAFSSDLGPRSLRRPLGALIDVLGVVPSVVYGLWGLGVLAPALDAVPPGEGALRWIAHTIGAHVLAAGLVLAAMIVPTIASVSREVLLVVPDAHRDAAISLGATPWDVLRVAVLPSVRAGLGGAVLLGCNRAFGETMAVALVLGELTPRPDPSPTLASAVLGELIRHPDVFAAGGVALPSAHTAAVVQIALALAVVAIAMSLTARWLVEASKQRARFA